MGPNLSKSFEPYVPANKDIPEFTLRAIIIGIILAVLMGAANTYLGLYAGMTVSASIPAAVISMGILRGILRRGTILENNIVQTVASTGESLAAGVIFTIPALIIAGVWQDFDYWTVTLVTLFGGLLGILFFIPIRSTLIVKAHDLVYPEGVACAEVLKVGEHAGGGSGMRTVFSGLLIGAILKFFVSAVTVLRGTVEGAFQLHRSVFYFGTDISAALIAVGAIVGMNIATLVFIGGALGWIISIPLMSAMMDAHAVSGGDVLGHAWMLWSTQVRYIGVGAMVVAGLWSIVNVRHGILAGVKEAIWGYKHEHHGRSPIRTETNLSRGWVLGLLAAVAIPLAFYCFSITGGQPVAALSSWLLIIIVSFFLVAVAAYIVGLVGSSNSPVSGMTICALLLTAGIFVFLGYRGTPAILATLLIAGVVCCATCTSGDIAQDLKTGHLLGATPRRQQIAQIIGAIIPAFFFAPILMVLHRAYGIGTDAPGALRAPQATLFAKLVEGIFGDGTLPQDMLIIGGLLAVGLILIDSLLKRNKKAFRLHPMPVAVGLYLPLTLSVPILIGGMIHFALTRNADKAKARSHGVVLASSGLIAGEALMGILIAVGIVVFQATLASKIFPVAVALPSLAAVPISVATLAIIIWYLINTGMKAKQ